MTYVKKRNLVRRVAGRGDNRVETVLPAAEWTEKSPARCAGPERVLLLKGSFATGKARLLALRGEDAHAKSSERFTHL